MSWKASGRRLRKMLMPEFFNRFVPYLLAVWVLLVSTCVYAQEVIPVTVQPLSELLFYPLKKAPARVVSLQNSRLSSQLSALVKSVEVQVGDSVKKNQLLVRLECDDYELAREQLQAEKKSLQADARFARYQFERSKKLLKSKSVSEESYQQQLSLVRKLDARLQLLDSKIKQAEKNIDRCQIKAPFDGVITQRLIHTGENVSPGTSLLRLMDTRNLEVEVQVPVMLVNSLNYKALNFVYHNHRYPLKIRAVVPSIETRARHQRVRLSFSTEKAQPNAFGTVEITLQEQHVPANVLVKRNNQFGIFIVKTTPDGHTYARFHPLKNALTGRSAKIDTNTLPLNTRVIIQGRQALTNETPVKINNNHDNNT